MTATATATATEGTVLPLHDMAEALNDLSDAAEAFDELAELIGKAVSLDDDKETPAVVPSDAELGELYRFVLSVASWSRILNASYERTHNALRELALLRDDQESRQ